MRSNHHGLIRYDSLWLATILGLLVSACSQADCPDGSVRRGNRCVRCTTGPEHPGDRCEAADDAGEELEPELDGGSAGDADAVPNDAGPSASADESRSIPAFSTVNDPRQTSASGTPGLRFLRDDGFEFDTTVCGANGACLTGSIHP